MPFIRAGKVVTHYYWQGAEDAPILLMGNSLGTNFHMWDAQVPALAQRFRVLRYDMRGHGLSEAPSGIDAYRIEDLADDALALLDALKVDRFHYCGLSIGGMVGQRLGAKAAARIRSLALCNTAMRMATPQIYRDRADFVRENGLEPIVDTVLQRWFNDGFLKANPAIAIGMRNMVTRNSVAGYAGCCLALAEMDLEADLARIACPTLVLVGGKDQATPPEAGRKIAAAIKGAKLVEIPGAAHISTVEEPAAVTAALMEFFAA
ncbi:MAG TPA: 3-oxoadipate enol-lactonase [Stellaceae bacterium]|nr:3-oxoadipate enol-lactonase [Stellaceae bacterium]